MNRGIYIALRFLLGLAIGLSVLSCSGFELGGFEDNSSGYRINVTARSSADTRIAHNDLELSWEQKDALKIVAVASDGSYANSELAVYQIDENNRSCASFSGFVSMLSQPQECYFLYPSSASTSYNSSTGRVKFQYNLQTGRHEPMMYAKTVYDPDGMVVDMKHAGSVLQLSVQIPEVTTITFAGNNLENIYPVEVNPESGEIFLSTEIGVQISVPVQTDGPTYICVPPVKLEKGFSLICSKADGTYLVKSFSSDGSLSGGYDFSSKVGSLIPITLTGEFETFQVSATELSGNHTKNGNLLSGTEISFKMNKSGASNKLIEEWGANLLNSNGQVVRTVKYTNATPIVGQSVKMEVANNWKLLPAGEYVFTPYYKMYGQYVTLASQIINVADPGVVVNIVGNTSYDKYLAGNVSGANGHTNTLIEGVAVSTNLDNSIIDSKDFIFDGSSLGSGTWASGTMTFGNLTRTELRAYSSQTTVKVGNLTFNASRVFHITGLPLVADFTVSSQGWGILGEKAKHDGNRIFFESKIISKVNHAVVSPALYIPGSSLNVLTYADISCKKDGQTLYVNSCVSSSQNIAVSGSTTISIAKQSSLKSVGYIKSNQSIALTSAKPSLMFAATTPASYGIALHKIKVEYK